MLEVRHIGQESFRVRNGRSLLMDRALFSSCLESMLPCMLGGG